MCGGDLGHADVHEAVGHEVVAQKDVEGLATDLLLGLEHRMSKAERCVLVDEGHGQRARLVDALCQLLLAMGAQIPLEHGVFGGVGLDLGLDMGVDDDRLVDALGLQGLLDHILDDGLVKHGEELLGAHLGGGKKAGAEACGGNDSLH